MVSVRLKNPNLVLTPISEVEAEKDLGYTGLYVLYKDSKGTIQVGIPDMGRYSARLANMSGYEAATEKGFFYNGSQKLIDNAENIKDRPVYVLEVDDHRQVVNWASINDVDVSLDDTLNGTFQITEDNIDSIMHPDQMKP